VNDEDHRRREEEQIEREAAGELLAHLHARREADEARTRHLLDQITSGVEPELSSTRFVSSGGASG
jgi:hypothetical protein